MGIVRNKRDLIIEKYGKPNLLLDFAGRKKLFDSVGKGNPVSFSRPVGASASPGTYVGSDGLIKTAAVNEVLYSEQFETWVKAPGVIISANQSIAPDGKQTADKITIGSNHGVARINTIKANAAYTFSVWLRSDSPTTIYLGILSPSLVSQVAISTEWTRLSWSGLNDSGITKFPQMWLPPGSATRTIYAWGAQLVEGSDPGPYIRTTSTVGGEPRFDHDPVTGESLGLLVEEARTNLVFPSNDFTAWAQQVSGTGVAPIITPGFDGPLGTGTASRLQASVGAGTTTSDRSWIETVAFPVGDQCATLYVKSNNGLVQNIYFGPSSATLPPASVGLSWQRIDACYPSVASTSSFRVGTIGVYGFDKTIDILISAAQGEQATFPTSYIPTTGTSLTRAADVAAVQDEDFSTTNLLTYSEQFDNAAWTKQRVTITANSTTAPDGKTTADKLVEDNTASTTRFLAIPSVRPSGTTTFSVFAKAAERDWVGLSITNGNSQPYAFFDLTNGVVGKLGSTNGTITTTASIENVGNGWYRCSVTWGLAIPGTANIFPTTADDTFSYTGDGTSGVYLWGAQLTATEYPVDYIKTEASAVTKYKWYNPTEGTLAVEASSIATGTRGVIGIDDNTANERIEIQTDGTDPELLVIDGGSGPTVDAGGITASSSFSFAGAYKDSDIAATVNGGTVVTDTGTIPTVNRMRIGALQASGTYLNGHIKRVYYWPKRLSNEALQERTK